MAGVGDDLLHPQGYLTPLSVWLHPNLTPAASAPAVVPVSILVLYPLLLDTGADLWDPMGVVNHHRLMTITASRPAVFAPAPGQRRWVRDQRAAVFAPAQGRWVHFVRIDQPVAVMVDAPYDHADAGAWQRRCRSCWQHPPTGACFAALDDAAAWVAALPRCWFHRGLATAPLSCTLRKNRHPPCPTLRSAVMPPPPTSPAGRR